jgi:ZIP family zinc transporter
MLIDYWQLLLLGSIAGFTIFLGLPVAALQRLTPKQKGFLNAVAIGILVFLIIDVFSHAWESTASFSVSGCINLDVYILCILPIVY